MNIAHEDQRQAAIRELHASAAGYTDRPMEDREIDELPDGLAIGFVAVLAALFDGDILQCEHLSQDAPQPCFSATWMVDRVVVCERCLPLVIEVPDDPFCCCCGVSTDRVIATLSGPLMVFSVACESCCD